MVTSQQGVSTLVFGLARFRSAPSLDLLIPAVRVFGAGRPEDGMDIHLECVDPAVNRYQAYHVAIEADLFAERALVVSWGRMGRQGRTREVGSGDAMAVRAMAERLLRRRERHGYVVVRWLLVSRCRSGGQRQGNRALTQRASVILVCLGGISPRL